MQTQLLASGVPFERWPALRGGPELLRSHASYFERGVESHLYVNHTQGGVLSSWGTIGTYLSHHTLFEHIVAQWKHNDSAAFVILQDDTKLRPRWLKHLRQALRRAGPEWQRMLLVWWGLARRKHCDAHLCTVRPPAGPTEEGDAECCGKRFYHGLQAWIVRVRSLRCLLRRLRRRPMKNIDALMVSCDCPRTYALPHWHMLGEHLDREMGSERAAVDHVWRASLEGGSLKRHAQRNIRKVRLPKVRLPLVVSNASS